MREGARMSRSQSAFKVGAGEGDARDVLGSVDVVKASADQTGGSVGLIEWDETKGSGPPLHVHSREDEAYFIVEGDVTFFIGEQDLQASAGTFVFAPRGLPHSWSIESDHAIGLQFIIP